MTVFPGLNEHPTRPGLQSPPLIDLGIKILLLIWGVANDRGFTSRFHASKGLRHASNSLQQKGRKQHPVLLWNSSWCQSNQLPWWLCTVTTTCDGPVLTDATLGRILLAVLWSCNKSHVLLLPCWTGVIYRAVFWTLTVCFNTKHPLEGNKQFDKVET